MAIREGKVFSRHLFARFAVNSLGTRAIESIKISQPQMHSFSIIRPSYVPGLVSNARGTAAEETMLFLSEFTIQCGSQISKQTCRCRQQTEG